MFGGFNPMDAFELMDGIGSREVLDFIAENFSEDKLALSVVTPIEEA